MPSHFGQITNASCYRCGSFLSFGVALYQRWVGFVKCWCQISFLLILHTLVNMSVAVLLFLHTLILASQLNYQWCKFQGSCFPEQPSYSLCFESPYRRPLMRYRLLNSYIHTQIYECILKQQERCNILECMHGATFSWKLHFFPVRCIYSHRVWCTSFLSCVPHFVCLNITICI